MEFEDIVENSRKATELLVQVAESTKKVWEKERKKNRKIENSIAKLIAIVVRNKMEEFHVKHLSDAQMKELNPIIRNAIYTALVQMRLNPDGMSGYGQLYIPQYWEDCEMVKI